MRLLINGGDGDQSYFGRPMLLESANYTWFDANTPRGHALLFRIVEGKSPGTFVALTSRVMLDLKQQLENQRSASVVVNIVKQTGDSFRSTLDNFDAIGMAFADVVEPEP
jgi:hypothetical protein